jgi:hypothetical protein
MRYTPARYTLVCEVHACICKMHSCGVRNSYTEIGGGEVGKEDYGKMGRYAGF